MRSAPGLLSAVNGGWFNFCGEKPFVPSGYLSASGGRSNVADSTCSVLRTVPRGTRYTNSHEYSGTDPMSTNCTDVLYVVPSAAVATGRFIGPALKPAGTLNAIFTTDS